MSRATVGECMYTLAENVSGSLLMCTCTVLAQDADDRKLSGEVRTM